MSDRSILHAPAARTALLQGMTLMTDLLRPTLGPTARTVAVASALAGNPPEILDQAATIARRTVALDAPFANMGAMIVRHLVWRVHEAVGDGTATAAVIAQGLMSGAATYLAAGGDPYLTGSGIRRGLAVALTELRRQARPIALPAEIARVVAGSLGDPKLAAMIGEILDAVGPDGAVLIRDGRRGETAHEYVEGIHWQEGSVSPFLLEAGGATAQVIEPRIFVTDAALERADQLVPVIETCLAASERTLFVVAPEVRDAALAVLVVNRDRGVLDGVLAVKAPSFGAQRSQALEDIAAITGGRCLRQELGERGDGVTIGDLGAARQAWATRDAAGILGGRGDKAAIRRRIDQAKTELRGAPDDDARQRIQERIGRLTGAAAVIRVGGATPTRQAALKLRIEAAVTAARAALRDGVVPGGGAALLACLPALEALCLDGDEAVGVKILARALVEPMRAVVGNAGLEPTPIIHDARRRGPGWTYDVLRREWVEAWSAAVVDPLPVLMTALEASVSAVTTAMTTDVLIRGAAPAVATTL